MNVRPTTGWNISKQFPYQKSCTHRWHTPRLCQKKWIPTKFYFVVDDFGVKYVRKEHTKHIITGIKKYYPVSVDWTWELYCGVSLDWDYIKVHSTLSTPGYVESSMHE